MRWREVLPPREFSQIMHIASVWAAFDIGWQGYSGKQAFPNCHKATRAVRNLPLVPSIIVESVRGVHHYWLLDEPMKVLDVARIDKGLQTMDMYFRYEREVKIDTMLRVPGTFNKRIPDLRVTWKIKYMNSALRYTSEDVDWRLGQFRRWGIHLTK
jgi:hypothetical protein